VKQVVGSNNKMGYRAIKARLEGIGVRVAEKRVQASLRRIDPLAVAQRYACLNFIIEN